MSLQLIELLYEALNSELGVIVETPDPQRARSAFYRARNTDDALQVISILQCPWAPNQLILLRNTENEG